MSYLQEIRSSNWSLNAPMNVGCMDTDGDCGTVALQHNEAQMCEYAEFTYEDPFSVVNVLLNQESTLITRLLYGYLNWLWSQRCFQGWGDLGSSFNQARGSGICKVISVPGGEPMVTYDNNVDL